MNHVFMPYNLFCPVSSLVVVKSCKQLYGKSKGFARKAGWLLVLQAKLIKFLRAGNAIVVRYICQ